MSVDKHAVFEFLNELRESDVTNMFGASPYVQEAFDISGREAKAFLLQWITTFSDRHPQEEHDEG